MKYVVIGAGGGNDVFSSMAYADTLGAEKVLLVGILGLTPFHYPTAIDLTQDNQRYTEPPLMQPTSEMVRYIMMDPPKKINCSERLLVASRYPTILLSSKYSAPEQASNLSRYLESHDYTPDNTVIHLVDFGGDILTDGSHVISPELDAFSLAVVRLLPQYHPRVLVMFPGVDGELSKDFLREQCRRATPTSNTITLASLERVYELVKNSRPGNTIKASTSSRLDGLKTVGRSIGLRLSI